MLAYLSRVIKDPDEQSSVLDSPPFEKEISKYIFSTCVVRAGRA